MQIIRTGVRWRWIAAVVLGVMLGLAFALVTGVMGENALTDAWQEPWI